VDPENDYWVYAREINFELNRRNKVLRWVVPREGLFSREDDFVPRIMSPFFTNDKELRQWWEENTETVGKWRERGQNFCVREARIIH